MRSECARLLPVVLWPEQVEGWPLPLCAAGGLGQTPQNGCGRQLRVPLMLLPPLLVLLQSDQLPPKRPQEQGPWLAVALLG